MIYDLYGVVTHLGESPDEEDELIENIRRKIIYYGRSIKIRGRRNINYRLQART